MAKPTSAFFKAGPSFVPSPVTATTSRFAEALLSIIPLTRVYLSVGEERASTRSLGQTLSNKCCWTSPWGSRILLLNSLPSKIRKSSFGLSMPHFNAIDLKVKEKQALPYHLKYFTCAQVLIDNRTKRLNTWQYWRCHRWPCARWYRPSGTF